jgi:hypothetical protein
MSSQLNTIAHPMSMQDQLQLHDWLSTLAESSAAMIRSAAARQPEVHITNHCHICSVWFKLM